MIGSPFAHLGPGTVGQVEITVVEGAQKLPVGVVGALTALYRAGGGVDWGTQPSLGADGYTLYSETQFRAAFPSIPLASADRGLPSLPAGSVLVVNVTDVNAGAGTIRVAVVPSLSSARMLAKPGSDWAILGEPAPSKEEEGLGTGAKVAIGLGIAAVVVWAVA